MNRFSYDTELIDTALMMSTGGALASVFWVLGAAGVMMAAAPYTTIALVIILILFGSLLVREAFRCSL